VSSLRKSHLSLGAKLALAFGLVMALTLVSAILAVTKMNALSSDAADAKLGAVLDEQIMSVEIAARAALEAEADALLSGSGPELDKRLEAAWTSNGGDAFAEALAEATRLAVLDMPSALKADKAAGEALQASIARTVELVRSGDIEAAQANRSRSTLPAFETFLEKNQAVEAQSETFSEAAAEAAVATAAGGKRLIMIVTIAALLLAGACAFFITRGITRRVKAILDRLASLKDNCTTDLSTGLGAVASGDLTHTVSSSTTPIANVGFDEIGRVGDAVNAIRDNTAASIDAYNRMVQQLAGVMGELSQSAGSVNTASQQVATTADEAGRAVSEIASALSDVALGAERQVRMVETTRAAVQEASRAASSSAETAVATADAAERASRLAEEGVDAAGAATDAIRLLADSSRQVGTAIDELSKRSNRIGGIVDTITGIAEQTNLLALNAAIEAARAGEQGRGFAVVAEEVRKLAEESSQAAGQISGLIEEIQRETRNVVDVVERTSERTTAGAATVEQARDAFEQIGATVEDMGSRVGHIAEIVESIAAGAGSVQNDIGAVTDLAERSSAATEQVSASAQETSAAAQEIAASAESLSGTAEELERIVARFRLVPA